VAVDGGASDYTRLVPRKPALPADERLTGLVAVLDHVRTTRSATRAQLVDATGLSRAVVAQRVQELVDYGLVTDGELAPSTGGRAPRTVRFRADAGRLLVADLGATSVDVAVADVGGTLLAHVAEPCDIAAGPDAVLGRVDELFEQCLREHDWPHDSVWGIGIGVPGPVEFESGRPVAPPIMPGWDGYAVRTRFARYGVPVWVDNDVNVMALGEVREGVARGHENVVFIKIGTGIGAGIIAGGKLHRGAQGCAGDVGHIQVADSDHTVCRCGNIGCLEALAGGAALARDGEALARSGESAFLARVLEERGRVEAADVSLGASHGDPACVDLINRAGEHVGVTLAGIVNFFNPSLVVIGGGVAGMGDQLLATIRQTVYRRSLPLATRDLLVKRSTLAGQAGVVGAAAMVTDELFAPDRLGRWLAAGAPRAAAVQ
jgi:glucokinase-like ROK family protein